MKSFRQTIESIISTTGWKRRGLAFFLGVLATFTLPPFFIFPLLFISYSGLYLLTIRAGSKKSAFWGGWWWGWGHYMTGIYWFCVALMTDMDKFAWLIPFSLFGLTGVIAIYPALACLGFSQLKNRGLSRLFLFASVWTVVEFARGHLLSGFPWNLPAYSLMFSDVPLQTAALIGAYGMSFWAVLLGAAPAAFFDSSIRAARAKIWMGSLASIFAVLWLWGEGRLQRADKIPEDARYVEGVNLRLVQANIQQEYKWGPGEQVKNLRTYMRLTKAPGIENIDTIIWPETAVPYVIKPDSQLTRLLGDALPAKAQLITGTLRDEGENESWKVWNSIMVLDHAGDIVGNYDKSKLVPFGEFLPLRWMFPKSWLTPVGDNDFSRGEGMQTLRWPHLPPVSPLICYEVIFPERAVNEKDRPEWLLSVTNDAWFGSSTGPYQHFHMARMRSAEQGLPLIRAANTGISASIDPYGRVLAMLPLGKQGVLDLKLPKPLPYITTCVAYKNILMLLWGIFSLILIIKRKN